MDTILRLLITTSEKTPSSITNEQHLLHKNHCHLSINMISNSNGFYKFLARYSGRRRSSLKYIDLFISHIVCCLVIFSLFNVSEACSSRTIPKPRPPPTPTPRPNITFHTYACPDLYERFYCQNGGKCFAVRIGSDLISNCECPEGLGGVRCEFKQIDGSFLPTAPKTLLETASIASGATLAVIASIIFFCVLYYRYQQREKIKMMTSGMSTEGGENNIVDLGVDTVDGITTTTTIIKCEHHKQQLRPFGSHHNQILPLSQSLKR